MIRGWALGITGMAFAWLVAPPGAAAAVAASAPPATPSVERRRDALALDAPRIHAAASPRAEERAAATAGGLHLGAAGLHMATLVGLGIGWYEWQIELNKADFDFPRTVGGQWHRLTSAAGYRFDDNERYLNVGHAGMGAMYYQTARVHGATVATSYLFDLGTSTLWETAVEHREVVSVNDQLVTTFGGAPLGEALFRISDVFARGKPSFVNRLLMSLASPMRLGAWLLGDGPPARSDSWDDEGLDASVAHRFEVALGTMTGFDGPAAPGADDLWSAAARADLEVVALPAEERGLGAAAAPTGAMQGGGWLHGGEATRLLVEMSGGRERLRGFDLQARTTLWGRYDQAQSEGAGPGGGPGAGPGGGPGGGSGDERRSTRLLATASAFELAYNVAGGVTDFLSLVHVLGPTADLTWSSPDWMMRAEVTGYGDFAMVRPMALGTGVPSLEGTKSTLAAHEYVYGWGGTAATRVVLGYHRWRMGASAEWNHVESIEGLDRHQVEFVSPTGVAHPAIVDDSHLTDDRLKARLFVSVPVPVLRGVSVDVAGELERRRGDWQARALSHVVEDRRLSVTLAYTL